MEYCKLPPHLMRLLERLITNYCFLKEMCYWTDLHAGHVWFFSCAFLFVRSYFLFFPPDGFCIAFKTSSKTPHFFFGTKEVTGLSFNM